MKPETGNVRLRRYVWQLCVCGAFALCGLSAAAAPLKAPQPRFRSFSVAQGLPSSETYFVHQDRKGFMWICTDRGVARYDGYRFQVFTKKDGLADNVVFRIYEDVKGRLWFITLNGLLSYYENGAVHPYKFNDKIGKLLSNDRFVNKDLYVGANDAILYTMGGKGVFRIDAKGRMNTANYNFNYNAFTIYRFNGEYHPVFKVTREATLSTQKEPIPTWIAFGPKKKLVGMHTVGLDTRITEAGGFVYFLSERSLYCISKQQRLVKLINSVSQIALFANGNELWVGSVDGGATRYAVSPETGELTKKETFLGNYSVSGIEQDLEGGYWFSTLENGVFYAPNLSVRNLTKRQGLLFTNVISINGLQNNVYAMNSLGMHQQLNAPWASSAVAHTIHQYDIPVFGSRILLPYVCQGIPEICNDNPTRQREFVNTPKGLLFLSGAEVMRIRQDGSSEHLYDMWGEKKSSRYMVRSLAEDSEGTVFFGGSDGVFRLNDGKRFPLHGERPLFRKTVTDLDFGKSWGIVVGTKDTGVFAFKGNRVTLHLDKQSGITDDVINKVLVDPEQRLWIATNKGISVVFFDRGKRRIVNLTTSDGLITNEVRTLYVYGDTAWIATKKGIAVLPIAENLLPQRTGHLFFESMHTPGGTHDGHAPVPLPTRTAFVKVVFGTSNFRTSSLHNFRYRLQADGVWINSTRPEIVLLSPAAGDYSIEVSYRTASGDWSVPEVFCRFSVAPAFYETWYFLAGLILLGAGFGFLLFRLRIRQLSRRHKLQKTISELEQKALRAQMNPHFIFNSLNSIQSFLMYEENEKAERYLLKFAQLIRQTLNNSRESYIAIQAEMETLRRYLELEQMRFRDKFTFAITCRLTHEELAYGVPPMLIQPFVENAVLHGFRSVDSGGRVDVVFESLSGGQLLCTVDDNGAGRKTTLKNRTEGHKSFGTKITAERLEAFREKYGDDFTIAIIDKEENGVPSGTKVVLRIPVVPPQELTSTEE